MDDLFLHPISDVGEKFPPPLDLSQKMKYGINADSEKFFEIDISVKGLFQKIFYFSIICQNIFLREQNRPSPRPIFIDEKEKISNEWWKSKGSIRN